MTWLRDRGVPCLAVLLLLLAPPLAAQRPAIEPGIAFATVGGRPLLMDLYRPAATAAPVPVVLWLHDGGWLTGTRELPDFVTPLTARGIAVASIDYRLTSEAGRYGSEGVTFPAQIHDVKAAIRYLRAHAAELGLDPARVGAWGSSAGGHLAALAGSSGNDPGLEGGIGGNLEHSSRVQAVVDYYGPVDLLQLAPDTTTPPGSTVAHDPPAGPGSLLIGYSASGQGLGVLRANAANPANPYPTYLALARAASPLTFLDRTDPPFLIVHGSADTQVAMRQSERLRDGLRQVGADPQLVVVPNAGHGGFPAAVHQQAIDFLVATLTTPVMAIGEPAAIAGAWYEPATAGQGLELQWLADETLLAIFYGHRADGSNLFLIGTRIGLPAYGEALSIPLVATSGGRFTGLDAAAIRRTPWGTLTLTFASCTRASARLEGADGTQTLALEPLVRPAGRRCD